MNAPTNKPLVGKPVREPHSLVVLGLDGVTTTTLHWTAKAARHMAKRLAGSQRIQRITHIHPDGRDVLWERAS